MGKRSPWRFVSGRGSPWRSVSSPPSRRHQSRGRGYITTFLVESRAWLCPLWGLYSWTSYSTLSASVSLTLSEEDNRTTSRNCEAYVHYNTCRFRVSAEQSHCPSVQKCSWLILLIHFNKGRSFFQGRNRSDPGVDF